MDFGSRYVGGKELEFVLKVAYGGREGLLHVTRGVEGFDVQGGVVGEVVMSSSIEVLFEVVGPHPESLKFPTRYEFSVFCGRSLKFDYQ